MNLVFFNFLIFLNAFIGAHRKDHNTFLSYITLFEFNKQSIINYKMMKLQFRLLLILFYNLLVRETSTMFTNYDREFASLNSLSDLHEELELGSTETWINPCLTNRSGYYYSKAFITQQSLSAFLNSFMVINVGNIKYPNLNYYLMKQKSILFSSINTNAELIDTQYYVTINTIPISIAFFLYKLFYSTIKKVTKLDNVYAFNTILNFRYWYSLRHIFTLRYVRRAFFLKGMLAKGIFFFCLQKLLKSYRRITLYNLYCEEFIDDMSYNPENNSLFSIFLKTMRESRLFRLRTARRRFLRRQRAGSILKFYQLKIVNSYFFDLSRRRLRLKRFLRSVTSRFAKPGTYPNSAPIFYFTLSRFFLNIKPRAYKRYKKLIIRKMLVRIFNRRKSRKKNKRYQHYARFKARNRVKRYLIKKKLKNKRNTRFIRKRVDWKLVYRSWRKAQEKKYFKKYFSYRRFYYLYFRRLVKIK